MHNACVLSPLRFVGPESENAMAAKCSYIEKVGAIYYVRKRIPRAWKGKGGGEVLRLSLRTKDRAQALRWGLEALAVFEELLRMEPAEALKHLTRRLIEEQLLRPEDMTGADLIRRRALGNIGAKIIRNAREENLPTEQINAIYRELVFVSKATVDGETLYARKRPDDTGRDLKAAQIDQQSCMAWERTGAGT